jgi:RNA polymerase sigma-70 factor (ECF subfamily)
MDEITSDDELMNMVVYGNLKALEMLLNRYRKSLYSFLFRITQNEAIAEDIVQDTFIRLYDTRRKYKNGMIFRNWLFTIGHNLAIDELRKTGRIISDNYDIKDVVISPEESATDNIIAEIVRKAVGMLPTMQQAVIVLKEYEGFNYREIASIIGISEEAARVNCHRAKCALKKMLVKFM